MDMIFGLLALMGVSAFCLIIVVMELIFDCAYKHIPWVHQKWNAFCETLPDWGEEEEGD